METEEYKQRLQEIEAEFQAKKDALARECAISNNPYKKGDFLMWRGTWMRIDSIKWKYADFGGIPHCVYFGAVLKKDFTPRKDGEQTSLWHNCIEEHKSN